MVVTGGTQDSPPERGVASLQGTIQRGEFLGPPGYGEHPGTDRRDTWFYLQLPARFQDRQPACRLSPDVERRDEYFIQLRVDGATIARVRRLIGRKVQVSGTIDAPTIGQDRTGIIMNVQKVDAISDWNW
jgi:hypothetical protein